MVDKNEEACRKKDTMGVTGIGVDIIKVSRVERLIREKGQRFIKRIFTDAEQRYCGRFKQKAERYAARFAAKEAVRKAVSPLYRGYYNFREIEVVRRADGMPGIKLHGKLAKLEEQNVQFMVSLSHEQDYAIAVVVMIREPSVER